MFTTAKLALAAALVLGAASAVQANDNDRNDRGGFRIGPMGQHFGGANPAYHRSMRYGDGAFAFVPGYPSRHYRTWDNWRWDWDR
jgi:hypothetical protein